MIRTKVYAKNIDYNTLVKLMMPYIEQWLTEKDNFFFDVFSKIISKKGRPTKFSSLLVSLVPKKDDLAASILLHFDEVMVEYLNKMLAMNNIVARVTSIRTDTVERNNETLLRIVMEIDEIDYESTMEHLMPQIIQKLSENEDNSARIGYLLLGMKDLPGKVMKAAINAIPMKERDDLVATVLTEYKLELRDALNSIISKNDIKAEISAFKIESIEEEG